MSIKDRKETHFWLYVGEIVVATQILKTVAQVQHGNTSVYLHSLAVAYYSYKAAQLLRFLGMKLRVRELVRGAFLHDYFLYDWHHEDHPRFHGLIHPAIACDNALQEVDLCEREQDIIKKHMFPLTVKPPRYRESLLVCLVDKGCAVYECFTSNSYQTLRYKNAEVLDVELAG